MREDFKNSIKEAIPSDLIGILSDLDKDKIAEAITAHLESRAQSVEGLFDIDKPEGEQPEVVHLNWL